MCEFTRMELLARLRYRIMQATALSLTFSCRCHAVLLRSSLLMSRYVILFGCLKVPVPVKSPDLVLLHNFQSLTLCILSLPLFHTARPKTDKISLAMSFSGVACLTFRRIDYANFLRSTKHM